MSQAAPQHKEEIVQDLTARALRRYGEERSQALAAEIEQAAERLALIGQFTFALDEDEPDFPAAPVPDSDID